jgi:hypothetical protein
MSAMLLRTGRASSPVDALSVAVPISTIRVDGGLIAGV